MNTDDTTLTDLIHRLRAGTMTSDHQPYHVAEAIEKLCWERRALSSQIRALEAFVTPTTGGAFRNVYAAGFRGAQEKVLAAFPLDDLAGEIMALTPDYALASRYAPMMSETRQ